MLLMIGGWRDAEKQEKCIGKTGCRSEEIAPLGLATMQGLCCMVGCQD